jgi:predicted transcriptional regulator of viral defense system
VVTRFNQTRRHAEARREAGASPRPRSHEQRNSASVLRQLEEEGKLEKLAAGLYALPELELTEHHSLAETAKRIPHGTVCLLSALRFHGLTTQAPFQVWLAIDVHAWRPKASTPPLRVVHMSGEALHAGVEVHRIEGVDVPVFNATKTVVDCFKFRNKIGLDVALEALRDLKKTKTFDHDELWWMAKICRVANVMRPYLEALA